MATNPSTRPRARSWTKELLYAFLAGVLVLVGFLVLPRLAESTHPMVGKPVPELTLPVLMGGPIPRERLPDPTSFAQLRGRVLVLDFWAPWCGPCRMLGPVIEKLSGNIQGVTIGKLNVDEAGAIAQEYDVASIPTMILFKGGKAVARTQGFQNEPQIRALIQPHL